MRLALSVKNSGYTILEVIMAIFIFGCVSAAVYQLLFNTDRLRGRAVFVKTATRLAAGEAELLRNIAAQNGVFEDSSYTVIRNERSYTVNRKIKNEETFSFEPKAREPEEIEIIVTDTKNETVTPLSFKLLIGVDDP